MKRIARKTSFLILLSLLISCGNSQQTNDRSTTLPVECSTVESVRESFDHQFPFISRPYRSTDLSFRVGGPVKDLDVHAGNYYRQGEVIAVIDPRDFQIRSSKAKALFEQADAEYRRIEALYRLKNISASAYEKAKADRATAEATHLTAQNELSDTRLVAPFDGYVQDVYFERYQDVRPSQPILSFVEINRLKIQFYVPQATALSIAPNQTLSLRFDAAPHETYSAVVADVSKGTTSNNLSFLVTAILSNSDLQLLSGMSGKVSVSIREEALHSTLLIPQKALRHRPKYGTFVWVLNPHTSESECRSVTIGKLRQNGMLEIVKGLSEGEQVITTALESLSEKQKLSVKNPN